MMPDWIFWAPGAAAVLHIAEEFVWPGGFAEWYRAYRPDIRSSLTPRWLAILNGLLLAVCLEVGIAGPTPRGVAGWLTLAALLAGNGLFHLRATLRGRRYSPGLITGIGLYVPLCLYGFWRFVRCGQASAGTAFAALLLGLSYPIWSMALHRRRARAAVASPPR